MNNFFENKCWKMSKLDQVMKNLGLQELNQKSK